MLRYATLKDKMIALRATIVDIIENELSENTILCLRALNKYNFRRNNTILHLSICDTTNDINKSIPSEGKLFKLVTDQISLLRNNVESNHIDNDLILNFYFGPPQTNYATENTIIIICSGTNCKVEKCIG